MESAVRRDLKRLGALDTGVRASLGEAALILARAIDSYAAEAKSPAELSAIAKAIQELRTTLAALMQTEDGGGGDHDGGGDLPAPAWDTAQPGPTDAGAAGGGGGPAAG